MSLEKAPLSPSTFLVCFWFGSSLILRLHCCPQLVLTFFPTWTLENEQAINQHLAYSEEHGVILDSFVDLEETALSC